MDIHTLEAARARYIEQELRSAVTSNLDDIDQILNTATQTADKLLQRVRHKLGLLGRGDPDRADPAAATRILAFLTNARTNPHTLDQELESLIADLPKPTTPTPSADPLPIPTQDLHQPVQDVPEPTTNTPAPATPTHPPLSYNLQMPAALQPMHILPPARLAPLVRLVPTRAGDLIPNLAPLFTNILLPRAEWPDDPPTTIPTTDPHYIFPGHALRIMASALRHMRPVLAVGDPGCGKTEFFRQCAAILRLPCTIVPVDGSLRRSDLIGSFRQVATPTGSMTPFIDGILPRAIVQPGLIVLDEIDQADPDIHYALHQIYEGRGLLIPEDGARIVPRHPQCLIVATANTKGRGSENGLTTCRNEMSEATRDRFPYWLEFDYLPPKAEARMLTAKTQIEPELSDLLVQIAGAIRAGYRQTTIGQPCSTRQLIDTARLAVDLNSDDRKVDLAIAIETVICGRATQEDAYAIRDIVISALGVDLNQIMRDLQAAEE